MKILRIVIHIILLSHLFSCSNNSENVVLLENVEKSLYTNVDSAQNLLNKINSTNLFSEHEKMQYEYLKNLIFIEQGDNEHFNDSIVGIVFDYAQNHNDKHFKAKASFLKGIS